MNGFLNIICPNEQCKKSQEVNSLIVEKNVSKVIEFFSEISSEKESIISNQSKEIEDLKKLLEKKLANNKFCKEHKNKKVKYFCFKD